MVLGENFRFVTMNKVCHDKIHCYVLVLVDGRPGPNTSKDQLQRKNTRYVIEQAKL